MRNIINIGSANIIAFGFQSFFNLKTRKLTFDITGLTTFESGGAANVVGISFSVIAPGGIPISTIDFTAPQILPASASSVDIDLPNLYAIFGWYQIIGSIKDQDGKIYSTQVITTEVCVPEGFNNGIVPGVFELTADCNMPQLRVTEKTIFSYKGQSAASLTKSGVLGYPLTKLSNLSFTSTPFTLTGSGKVFTGRYTINNTSTATYLSGDGVNVVVSYVTSQFEAVVTCNGALSTILCCVVNQRKVYLANPYSNIGKAAKAKLEDISVDFITAVVGQFAGADISDELASIKSTLNCDCGCGAEGIEPRPILAGGILGQIVDVEGINSADVSSATTGDTTTFTINVKDVILQKEEDDSNLLISKQITDNQIAFTIGLDMENLAENLLTQIQSDDDLTALLNQLITTANGGVNLSGFAGGCVISLANCNYTLIEPNNIAKTIISVTIDNAVFTAPSSLLMTNTSAVASWLNGLSKGTFSVNLDEDSNSVIINSNSNTHVITAFVMSTVNGNIGRIFTRACAGLVDILNAIVTFCCSLTAAKIEYGIAGQSLSTYNDDFTINSIPLNSATLLSSLITQIIDAQNALYDRLNNVGLTCANVKIAFQAVDRTIVTADGLLGTKGGACALIPFSEVFSIMLDQISGSTDLLSRLCGLTANCAGPVCAPVSNVSSTFTSGTLTVNCNDNGGGSTPISIRYRINNSGNAFTTVTTTAAALPFAIGSGALANGQYEVQVQKTCSNGILSPWQAGLSNNLCQVPIAFSVAISGSNFVATLILTSPQTKVEITMRDPNLGTNTQIYDLGGQTGSVDIAIPTGVYGDYQFTVRAVCDPTTTPIFASNFLPPAVVTYANPAANNFRVSTAYGVDFSDVSNGTASGVPPSFAGLAIHGNVSDHTSNLTSGTISFTTVGDAPMGLTIQVKLTKNGTPVAATTITAHGTYTITNPSSIAYPDNITLEIDQM